jgi:hypothetical protein
MIPLDLLFALSPSILLAGLWVADWMIASSLRPLMTALRRRVRRGRLNRQELLKLVVDASRRQDLRRKARLPG